MASATGQHIVAVAAAQLVVAAHAEQTVIAIAAAERVGAGRRIAGVAINKVVTMAAVDHISAVAGIQAIVAVAALQVRGIAVRRRHDHVVALIAVHAGKIDQAVGQACPNDRQRPRRPKDTAVPGCLLRRRVQAYFHFRYSYCHARKNHLA